MLLRTPNGLYCPAGDFHIDPCRGVERALITHAHSDHARGGSRSYACAQPGVGVLRERLGPKASITGIPYGTTTQMKDVTVSFHPAGHVLGSSQIRIEHRGEVWVVSGDYKVQPDPTCAAFEPVRCHTFITESTFGLPVYRWPSADSVFDEINTWWQANQRADRTSVLLGYSLGKAQRLLAGVNAQLGPILVHSTILATVRPYRDEGISLPQVERLSAERMRQTSGTALVLTPPQAEDAFSMAGPGGLAQAFASGWMLTRGGQRGRGAAAGFVLSDHADWPGLIDAIKATQARRILVTHGYTAPLSRWLRENGWDADPLESLPHAGEKEARP